MKVSQKQWLYSQIYLYIQQQKYTKAITLLKALNMLAPNDFYVTKSLARSYLGAGNHLLASKYAELAIHHSQDYNSDSKELALLHLIKSRAQLKLNQMIQAKESLDHFINFRQQSLKVTDKHPTQKTTI